MAQIRTKMRLDWDGATKEGPAHSRAVSRQSACDKYLLSKLEAEGGYVIHD